MSGYELFLKILEAMGSTIVLVGLGAFLGKVWSGRIIEKEKADYQKETESLRAKLAIANSINIRNSQAQFDLYKEVWGQLSNLRSIGDRLWDRVTVDELEAFRNALDNAVSAVNKGRLIILEEHYHKLQDIFDKFKRYGIGKTQLFMIRSSEEINKILKDFGEHEIAGQIRMNEKTKQDYTSLLDEIILEFRKQLGFQTAKRSRP